MSTPYLLTRYRTVYGAFVRNAFLNMLAYRMRYVTGIFTYLLFVSVHFFIWQAVFAGKEDGAAINGFTFSEMVTYVCLGWICRSLYFSNIDEEINDLVRTGQISIYLLRPVNFQLMLFTQAFGESLFRLFFFTIPIGIVILVMFPVTAPENATDFLLFLFATCVSFVILAEINFLVGMIAFVIKSVNGVMRAKYYLLQLLSGLLLPLTFFPDWARVVIDALPFKMLTYVPMQLYLGKVEPGELSTILATQAFWIITLLVVGQFAWKRAMARLTLQGG